LAFKVTRFLLQHFLKRIASGQFFSDYFYSELPPFYPPLYFWLTGGLAGLFKLSGVRAAQLGSAIILSGMPLLVYTWQRFYWSHKGEKKKMPAWRIALTSLLIFAVADWGAVIFKPYEFASAVLVVFWTAFLLRDIRHKLKRSQIIFYGITGGLLFMTFHFWFFIVAIACLLHLLLHRSEFTKRLLRLLSVAGISLLIASPYLVPLLLSFTFHGFENWQSAFFILEDLNLYLPFFTFSLFGFITLFGLLTLVIYRKHPYIQPLALLLVASYLWQFLNAISLLAFNWTVLPAKPFVFLAGAVLVIAAAFGVGEAINKRFRSHGWIPALFVVGWTAYAMLLPGGLFFNQESTQQQLAVAQQPLREEFANLVGQLQQVPNLDQLTLLSSGVPEISAYLPINYYVSYNIHFSHPAAGFSQRFEFIKQLAQSDTAQEFAQAIANPPIGQIDALLLFKSPDSYPIIFQVDNFPNGVREMQINIPTDLISEQYFAKVFEDKQFVMFRLRDKL